MSGPAKPRALDTHLVKLAVAALLRPFVTEHLAHVIEPLRLLRDQIVLDHRPHAACGTFRAQRQRLAVQAVDETIHFLRRCRSLRRMARLNSGVGSTIGMADRAIAIAFQPRTDGVLEQFPEFGFGGRMSGIPRGPDVIARERQRSFFDRCGPRRRRRWP